MLNNKQPKRRFLSVYIDPKSGRERMGTGGAGGAFHRYVSVENVIKFGLRHPAFPAGQYAIYSWPEGSGYGPDSCKFVTYAYKRV